MEGNKEIDNIEYNEILKLLTVELINNKWHFLNNDYITNIKKEDNNIKNVFFIDRIKKEIKKKLGYIGPYIFLTDFFKKYRFTGPYRDVEKCLLILYQLISGYSNNEMVSYVPYSAFYNLQKEFYEKYNNTLNSWIDNLLKEYFSNINIRLISKSIKNLSTKNLNKITLFMNVYDNRINYKESLNVIRNVGYKTLIISDMNDKIIYISKTIITSIKQENKKQEIELIQEIINNINFKEFMTKYDCLFINTLYPVVITIDNNEVIFKDANNFYDISEISDKTFNIDLFIDLSKNFYKLNNKFKQYCPERYNLELKLSALFLNIKKVNNLINLEQNNNMYKKWFNENFDFIKNNNNVNVSNQTLDSGYIIKSDDSILYKLEDLQSELLKKIKCGDTTTFC